MKTAMKYVSVLLFFVMMAVFLLITIIRQKDEFSENENRSLAQAPNFSVSSFFDESFMKDTDKYISDHFAFRNSLESVKLNSDLLMGKKEENGVLILHNRMVEPVTKVDNDIVSASVEAINHLADITDASVYVMIPPTAAGVYYEDIPKYYLNTDQKKAIDDIYYRFSDKVTTLNVFPKLYSSRDEYVYYRNDHHWTSYGAYLAYNAAIRKMGYNPTPMSSYDIEHVNSNFYGTFNSRTLYNGIAPDMIDVFHPKTGIDAAEVTIGGESYSSMYFSQYLEKKDKYSFYLNNAMEPIVNIKTNLQDGEKLLVIKDSYAQCFIPFLTQHFSEITAVDLRSISPFDINNSIDTDYYDKILVLYSFSGFASDTDLKKLSLLE